MTKAGLMFMGVAVVVTMAIGAWNAFKTARSDSTSAPIEASGSVTQPVAQPTKTAAASPGLEPSIGQGRRDLGDSVFAVREGNDVTVNFDTELLRTRFDWKFEGVVRATLPLVYGQHVTTVLDSVPNGTFANKGDLLTELPQRGIPLRVGEHTLRVYPVVRPGRDGPLVVGYRVAPGQ